MTTTIPKTDLVGAWPVDPVEILAYIDKMLSASQVLRVQQLQLINDSTWEEYYKTKANEAWKSLNEAHKELTEAIQRALEE